MIVWLRENLHLYAKEKGNSFFPFLPFSTHSSQNERREALSLHANRSAFPPIPRPRFFEIAAAFRQSLAKKGLGWGATVYLYNLA